MPSLLCSNYASVDANLSCFSDPYLVSSPNSWKARLETESMFHKMNLPDARLRLKDALYKYLAPLTLQSAKHTPLPGRPNRNLMSLRLRYR
jgi:hypothetical protein